MPTLKKRINLAPPTELYIRLRAVPGHDATNVCAILWAALRMCDDVIAAKPHKERTAYERDLYKAAKAVAYDHPLPEYVAPVKQARRAEAAGNGAAHDDEEGAWF